jgi:cytoplasmic FMR1 interacting protein
MFYMDIVARRGTPEQQALAQQANTLTRERLCMGLSMFQAVLNKVKAILVECDKGHGVWLGPNPSNGVMDIDECNQFHRLWSAIIYTSNVTSSMRDADQTLCVGEWQHRPPWLPGPQGARSGAGSFSAMGSTGLAPC